MAFTGSRVTVTTAATLLSSGADTTGDRVTDATSVMVKNIHASAAVDLGGSGVATGAGYSLAAGESVTIGPLGKGDDLYAVTASGTVVVTLLTVA